MTSLVGSPKRYSVPWKQCSQCKETAAAVFKSPREFCRHLRDFHCSKEGGSYVCRYGMNAVCPSLPIEGVSDKDYEDHVARDHVYGASGVSKTPPKQQYEVSPPSPPAGLDAAPSVVQDQHKWTIFNSAVNLPAVLNDPRLVKRESDFFTKTWGVDFYDITEIIPSHLLPDIQRHHFDKYLNRTTLRFKKHTRNVEIVNNPAPSSHTYIGKLVKQAEKNRDEIQQVPKLFLLPNFNLENPDTFSAVFPWTQVEESRGVPNTAKQSSKLLQEKLSHYLDIVEVQIAKQISMKSEAFFHAMTSHDELQDRMLYTCRAIKQLRDKIHVMDEMLARGSLKILNLSQSRANLVSLHNKLKLMATVHQTQPTIQLLLSTSEYVGALDLISTTQEVLGLELAGIHSFRHLGSQLAELEKLIDRMLQEDFCRYVSSELNRPVTDTVSLTEEEHLVSMVFGMLRQHKFTFLDVYREEAFTAIKAAVKQTVVEAVSLADDVDTEGSVTSLADQMRLLNYSKWTKLLCTIFSNLMVILNRAQAFHGVVKDVVGIAAGKTKAVTPLSSPMSQNGPQLEEAKHLHVSVSEDVDVMISEVDHAKLAGSLKEMICSICDHAHDRCVKVIVARAKDGFLEKLSSTEFVGLSKEVERFVSECHVVCGRYSTSLRGSLQSQANRYVNRFHEERRNKLSLILDNERWKQADVPAEFQNLVDHIIKTGRLELPEKKSEKEKRTLEYLSVDGERYAVVGTVLLLLKMLIEYCDCVNNIPTAAADLLTRLVDLLKIFNSRTCQLVLGAGALQLVGLKTISTKNLALASRCLQLVVRYMPIIKQHFELKLPPERHNMIKHLEQITKDYNDHIGEILNKLVTIMEGMEEAQLSKWEVKAPVPSACFRNICKQMGKLHEAIVDILPREQMRELFGRIHSSFLIFVRLQLVRHDVTNDGGPQHGLVTSDFVFYAGSFKALRGLEDLVQDMTGVWDKT
ncbi:hypothetical protein ScPMuIL_014201 [Solemya velum]